LQGVPQTREVATFPPSETSATEFVDDAAVAWFPLQDTTPPPRRVRPVNPGCGPKVPVHSNADASTKPRSRLRGECRVLLATADLGDSASPSLCNAIRACGYSTEYLVSSSREQLARALRHHSNSVLVIHTDLLKVIALSDLLQVRRQYPAALWILAWPTPAREWPELVVTLQARGCVDCDDLSNLKRTIDNVAAGNLWLPRWISQALYFNLLSRSDEARVDMTTQAASAELALTRREVQALEFMRQGLTNKEIAWRLQVSVNTVKKHLKHSLEKLGMNGRHQDLVRGATAIVLVLATLFNLMLGDLT
jgi:DNA-binding NarL/FixJ family response regulator